jgi:5-methylcytosine-specific restriction enzyme A
VLSFNFSYGLDKFGNTRKIIIFEFEKSSIINSDIQSLQYSVHTYDLNELREMATQTANLNDSSLQERKVIIRRRAAAIKKYALVRAKGNCEACEQAAPFFTTEGSPFLEVHHLNRLSDGGLDHPKNVAAICPNCHRRVHYSVEAISYNNFLKQKITIKEENINEKTKQYK